jgi:hypothetical protein
VKVKAGEGTLKQVFDPCAAVYMSEQLVRLAGQQVSDYLSSSLVNTLLLQDMG